MFVYLFVYMFVYLFVYLFVYMFVYLFVYFTGRVPLLSQPLLPPSVQEVLPPDRTGGLFRVPRVQPDRVTFFYTQSVVTLICLFVSTYILLNITHFY